jgi:hypothetical protein
MGTKNTRIEEKVIPIPENVVKGEGKVDYKPFTPVYKPIVAESAKKPISGWQKKFLGIPVWGWVIVGLILVWAGIIVGIVAYR